MRRGDNRSEHRGGRGDHIRGQNNAEPKEGDWYCKGCGDLQFAKNDRCRLCKAERPEDGGMGSAPSGPSKLVLQVAHLLKTGQRKCTEWKDSWTQFVADEGSINKDPIRHKLSALRRFLLQAVPRFSGESWLFEYEKALLEIVGYDLSTNQETVPILDEPDEDFPGQRRAGEGNLDDEVIVDDEEIHSFVQDNSLDEKAEIAFRELSPTHQRQVMNRGPLTDTRNPSAVVLARIRSVLQSANQMKSRALTGNFSRRSRSRSRGRGGRDRGNGRGRDDSRRRGGRDRRRSRSRSRGRRFDDDSKGKGKDGWGGKDMWGWSKGSKDMWGKGGMGKDMWDAWGKGGMGKDSWGKGKEGKSSTHEEWGKGGHGQGKGMDEDNMRDSMGKARVWTKII